MTKSITKYLFEFIVIFFGISVSFQFDKYNQEIQKKTLKNQSLNRILKNIQVDMNDLVFNLNIHTIGIESINWILDNYSNEKIDRVKFGKELTNSIFSNTIFVDNQEEYRSLQNSGLIEKIENDSLVYNLQNKYSSHFFYKKIEEGITNLINDRLMNFHYKNSISEDSITSTLDFINNGRIYVGEFPLERNIVEIIKKKKMYHHFYVERIKGRMKRDSILLKQIKEEIDLE